LLNYILCTDSMTRSALTGSPRSFAIVCASCWCSNALRTGRAARVESAGLLALHEIGPTKETKEHRFMPLEPLSATVVERECLCCIDNFSDKRFNWHGRVSEVLRSCMKLGTTSASLGRPAFHGAKTDNECQNACNNKIFSPSALQQKYRFGLFSGNVIHCLGHNMRTKSFAEGAFAQKLGGALNKVAKTFGSYAPCEEDAVFKQIYAGQVRLVHRMDMERKNPDNSNFCRPLRQLPAQVLRGDCMCCTKGGFQTRKWSKNKSEVLQKCLLAYRRAEAKGLQESECSRYCLKHFKCSSRLRKFHSTHILSKSVHCLAKNTLSAGRAGAALNKLGKQLGARAAGNCEPDRKYKWAVSHMMKKLAKIDAQTEERKAEKKKNGRERDKSKRSSKPPQEPKGGGLDPSWSIPSNFTMENSSVLTRFGKITDEKTFPWVGARIAKLSQRADGIVRLASPFEHVCGGNRQQMDLSLGADGPSQYVSFATVAGDCVQPWDIGQRRVRVTVESVIKQKAHLFDLSNKESAFKWCYEGGCVRLSDGTEQCFSGAKDVQPWPLKCAQLIYTQKGNIGEIPESWWTEDNRQAIANSCATWAVRAHEVLLLPDPISIAKKMTGNKVRVKVESDRDPALGLCIAGLEDRCVSLDTDTGDISCCSDSEAQAGLLHRRCHHYNAGLP